MFKKAIIALTLIFAVTCADGPLFDISKFLDVGINDGVPITFSNCGEENRFKVLRTVLKPETLIKGEDINIKVQGSVQEDMIIKNLHLSTKYNGQEIFADNKDQNMKEALEGSKYVYDYTAAIPTFTPSGSWDIFLILQDDQDKEINCLKAHFDMP